MKTYLRQLNDAGIETHVEPIHDFEAANTLGGQVRGQRELAKRFFRYQNIIFTDAFDVAFHGTKQDVLSKIPENHVLQAAERNCWPDPKLEDGMQGDTPWKFVNGGMLAGKPHIILRWLDNIEKHKFYNHKLCNQGFFNFLRYNRDPLIHIDETTELFYCLFKENRELQFEDGLPINTVCKTRPNFIHANGHWSTQATDLRRAKSIKNPPPKEPTMTDSKMLSAVGITIGLPFCGRPITPHWAVSLACMNWPLNTKRVMHTTLGHEIGEARCATVELAKNLHSKYVYFQDDDVVTPAFAVRSLLSTLENADIKTMVAAGIYCSKTLPTEPVVFRGEGLGAFWKWKMGDIFEVTSIGTGCMMINMEVFEHLEKPYFKTVDDVVNAQEYTQQNDDMYFCGKVLGAGYKVLADANVLCTHFNWDPETQVFTPFTLPDDSYPMRPVSDDEPRAKRAMTQVVSIETRKEG